MARTGLARALSKLGHCSRSQGTQMIKLGRVRLNGVVCRDPEKPVDLDRDQVVVDNASVQSVKPLYLMLNKPRGLVTTASDEQGRATVYECFQGASFPHMSPVGRLDKASEGLLLFTNDNRWADGITDPSSHLSKTYHVQIASIVDDSLLERLMKGITVEDEELLLNSVKRIRQGDKNMWLEVVIDEGRNRHIRRVLEAHQIEVVRLFRIAIGKLPLGKLEKGSWRHLSAKEVQSLSQPKRPAEASH